MNEDLVARAAIAINASAQRVWEALITPQSIKQYMFGTDVVSDWREGSSIVWKGEWQGKKYEDKGTLLKVRPGRTLQYTHFSPLVGLPDKPENYHTVTIELSADDDETLVTLHQDNNESVEARTHSERNWETFLSGLKKYVEQGASSAVGGE